MYSEEYKKLKKEIKEKIKNDKLSKNQIILLEQKIFQDLPKVCKCGRTENLTLDHIVPKQILLMFGIDIETRIIEENYQILCKLCNSFKANRLDFSIPQTKKILLELLNKI